MSLDDGIRLKEMVDRSAVRGHPGAEPSIPVGPFPPEAKTGVGSPSPTISMHAPASPTVEHTAKKFDSLWKIALILVAAFGAGWGGNAALNARVRSYVDERLGAIEKSVNTIDLRTQAIQKTVSDLAIDEANLKGQVQARGPAQLGERITVSR